MVTSKSVKKKKKEKKWIAGAFVFSGRPEPTWSVNKKLIYELEKVWNSIEHTSPDRFPSPSPPILGYRGCFVREYDTNTNHGWFVYKSAVTLEMNDSSELRFDRHCKFERLLLFSAPQGVLPDYCPKYEKNK
jgi:hypothetical protein